jgi:hypothetical protein
MLIARGEKLGETYEANRPLAAATLTIPSYSVLSAIQIQYSFVQSVHSSVPPRMAGDAVPLHNT